MLIIQPFKQSEPIQGSSYVYSSIQCLLNLHVIRFNVSQEASVALLTRAELLNLPIPIVSSAQHLPKSTKAAIIAGRQEQRGVHSVIANRKTVIANTCEFSLLVAVYRHQGTSGDVDTTSPAYLIRCRSCYRRRHQGREDSNGDLKFHNCFGC